MEAAKNVILLTALVALLTLFGYGLAKHFELWPSFLDEIEAVYTLESANDSSGTCDLESIANSIRVRLLTFGFETDNIDIQVQAQGITVRLKALLIGKETQRLLTQQGKLEFWETFENTEVYSCMVKADSALASLKLWQEGGEFHITEHQQVDEEESDSAISILNLVGENDGPMRFNNSEYQRNLIKNPLFTFLTPALLQDNNGESYPSEGPVIGYAAITDTALINAYFKFPEVVKLLPSTLKLLWTAKPYDTDNNYVMLIAGKFTSQQNAAMTNPLIHEAFGTLDYFRQPEISITMKDKEAEEWANLTRKNIKKSIAITVDEQVYTFPTVNSEISHGRTILSGVNTLREAQELAALLSAPHLQCKMRIVNEQLLAGELSDVH